MAALLALPMQAHATGTRAGSTISNSASATFDDGSGPKTVTSNQVDLLVDELLDVTVASSDAADVPTAPGATAQRLTFVVTNSGNGNEGFALTTIANGGGDNYDPTVTQLYIDNGNGVFDAGTDTLYVPGTNDPVLDPDIGVTIYVLSTTPGGVSDADRGIVQLVASSKTGTGTPGTSFAGAGEGGGNAVVGATGADGNDDGAYIVAAASVSLAKSAVVLDPFGGSKPVPGATITYTIAATISGSGTATNLSINDTIPADTTYVAGSITLGGAGLTDAADADVGSYDGTKVSVSLGNIPGGQNRTVTFKAIIK